ncbi:MAG: glycosyltransferase family 4 protein, partial [Patescibacteria group bacterium]
ASKLLAQLIDPDTDILNPHAHSYITAAFFKRTIKHIPSVWMMNDMPLHSWALWKESQLNLHASGQWLRRLLYTVLDWWKRYYIAAQDAVVVLDNMNEEFVRHYLKRPAFVVRSGLDLEQFSYVPRDTYHVGEIRILMTGIFAVHRRFEDVIEAVDILHSKTGCCLCLTIVGDQSTDPVYAHKIISLINSKGLSSQVTLLGRLSERDLCAQYNNNDVFIFPNVIQTWGLAVFEAMASGMPVIVSRGAGSHEVLTHGENALLVNPAAPNEIALAVERLMQDKELYHRLSKMGRMFVEEHISWERYAEDMEHIFKRYTKNS